MKRTMNMVLHLAKPELKVSWGTFIGLLLFYALYTELLVLGYDHLETDGIALLDLFYFMLFIFGPTWFKPKGIQYQKLTGNTWGSPTIVMNLHLPVKEKWITWKTIFIYFLSSFPFQLLMLLMLYLLSPAIREAFSPTGYLAFMIIWLSFGIYGGLGALYLEVIVYKMKAGILTTVLGVLYIMMGIALIIFFPYFFQYGMVDWSIILANNWGLASSLISILLAVAGLFYWSNQMTKQLKEVDYL